MKRRIRQTLVVCCLGLSGISDGATDAAETEELEVAETEVAAGEAEAVAAGDTRSAVVEEAEMVEAEEAEAVVVADTEAVEPAEADAVEVAETEVVAAEEAEADEAKESGGGGIFSSILRWFRGRDVDAAPVPEQAQERQREDGRKDVTLSHVYQATMDLIAEIEILRQATGVADEPGEAEPQEDQAPIHAYSKSLEVMEKTARVQRRLGMIPVEVGYIPIKNITPKDMYRNVQAIIEELRRVKRQLVIKIEIQPAPFAGGKTPSLVYKSLGDASFLLDGLVGRSTTSNDVYVRVLQVHDEMAPIAARLGVALESEPPVVEGSRESKEVAQQILRATYKVINLQSRLGVDASGVPNMALADVTPSEVFDATNRLLAELVRVKVHLNIQSPRPERPESRNKQPANVFAQVLLVIKNLDIMTKAAGNAD